MIAAVEDLMTSLPSAFMAVDLADRVIYWNRAAEELFGWTADEVLGHLPPNVPDDARTVRRHWIDRVSAGETIEVATDRLHRDGHRLAVILQIAPLRDADGHRIGTVAECRSAGRSAPTDDPRARQLSRVRRLADLVQILVRDLELAAVVESIVHVAVDVLDADGGVLSLSEADDQFFRVANVNIPDDLSGHRIVPGEGLHGRVLDVGAPVIVGDYDTWDGAVDAFRGRSFHAGAAVPLVHHHRTIGVLSVHSFEPVRRFDAEEVEVLQLLADYAVVALQNAETYKQVAAERVRFQTLVQAVAAGLAVVEDGVITAWNDAAAMLTGHSAETVLGRPCPIDLDAAADGLEVTAMDGRPRFVEAVRSELPRGGAVYLIHDLTEQRDLERAKDLFFATTSHELKTPLTVIKGLASTLLTHWERMTDQHRVESLATIERRAGNLDQLIERILVGSRVQAEAFSIDPAPVDVIPVINDIVAGFDAASPEHTVTADIPGGGLPLVAADRQVLDTILGHLLENAIKYSPEGGPVVVRARTAIHEPTGAPRVRIDVRDHGIGIDGDITPLLHPFVQAESHNTRRFAGVGLGLFIVSQLVDALGGTLSATRKDPGTEFSVLIPQWR